MHSTGTHVARASQTPCKVAGADEKFPYREQRGLDASSSKTHDPKAELQTCYILRVVVSQTLSHVHSNTELTRNIKMHRVAPGTKIERLGGPCEFDGTVDYRCLSIVEPNAFMFEVKVAMPDAFSGSDLRLLRKTWPLVRRTRRLVVRLIPSPL
jgi:hypothetical protein